MKTIMRIDHCLILAAGFGTRMGEIGHKLPKVLWPVFEKSLLDLQVAYARYLGANNIFINLHFMGEQIESHCKKNDLYEGVTFLWEKPDILDIGGAIHNMASQKSVKYKGKLLVLNADQFFFLTRDEFSKQIAPHVKSPATLFNYYVNSSLGYNAIKTDTNRMVKEIIKNKDIPKESKIETYTGISYIDLAQLEPVSGASTFFESVCPYQKKEISSILLEKVDYWDFGTLQRYWETSFKILETYSSNPNHPFIRFLVMEKALKTWKIDLQKVSYHSKIARVINLAQEVIDRPVGPSIILTQANVTKSDQNTIWYGEIQEKVKAP